MTPETLVYNIALAKEASALGTLAQLALLYPAAHTGVGALSGAHQWARNASQGGVPVLGLGLPALAGAAIGGARGLGNSIAPLARGVQRFRAGSRMGGLREGLSEGLEEALGSLHAPSLSHAQNKQFNAEHAERLNELAHHIRNLDIIQKRK